MCRDNLSLKEAATRSGHNYLPENELLSSAITLLNIDCDDIEQRVRDNMMDMVMLGDLVRYETKRACRNPFEEKL